MDERDSFFNNRGIASDSDSEMVGHFEESSGNDGRVVLLAKHPAQHFGIALIARKYHGSISGSKCGQVVTRIEEPVQNGPIGSQQHAGAISNPVELPECRNTHSFHWMGGRGIEQVEQAPHSCYKFPFGNYPAASKAA